ncbi:MAG: hypothetical protein ACXADU_02025 [Promethearchaeota archaeon]|jgi:hypothetical protein
MKTKSKRCVFLVVLFFLGIAMFNFNSLNYQYHDFNFGSFQDNEERLINETENQVQPNFGGYSSSNNTNFDVLENASSILSDRNFLAHEWNYFNTLTPESWNISSMQFEIESYSKEQKLTDSTFDVNQGDSPWNDEEYENGRGYFTQTFEPDDEHPDYVRTQIYNFQDREKDDPAFRKGNYALWSQTLSSLNPDSLDIQKGEIFQESDETLENFNNFETDPSFNKDVRTPYGGVYDPVWDLIELGYDDVAEALRVIIVPHQSMVGGNPSAAWWYFLDLPYAVEYAQVKLTWSIDDDSTFESEDEYEVKARINNKYIDGTNPISKMGDVPFNGSNNALMTYHNKKITGHIFHNSISRTYNITDLIDGLVGINKFDFGIWAKNPSHGGDLDIISAKFESIEFLFNTSNQYEVASLEFDYKCIDEDGKTLNPFIFENNASIFLVIDDLIGSLELIRVLPFSMMTISSSGFSSTPWMHVNFSLSEDYIDILQNNDLEVKLGIIFEENYYSRIYYRHYLDNVYFNINYKHPDVVYSDLKINIDNSGLWQDVTDNLLNIDTTGWLGGELHNFQFRSGLLKYQDNLYLNLLSELNVSHFNYNTSGSNAIYSIETANSIFGIWNIVFNNSISYNKLNLVNSTPFFNLSFYSISYLDIPAFDLNGSRSLNWDVFNAIAPNFQNYMQYLRRLNSSLGPAYQNSKILNTFQSGNWTLRARQRNYITNCSLNSTISHDGFPAYYKNAILQYNFSLYEDSINGNYSVSLLNGSGSEVGNYPKYYTSTSMYVVGTIDISEIFMVGRYFLYFKWNDTGEMQGKSLRFGSKIKEFFILNDTKAGFISEAGSVSSGDIADFSIYYRTSADWGIENATIYVFENSTGYWRLWGKAWTGTYQIGTITYNGEGNYSIPLYTSGAPNGTYTLSFSLYKQFHRPRFLITTMDVISINNLDVSIVWGAYLNPFSQYVINENNIPFVNDTINSRIQINITDQSTKNPITGGLVLGTIGNTGTYFEALEIGAGLYNLTLDTTGLNATQSGQNETLFIRCSASDYNTNEINVTIYINKIITEISLQNIGSVYTEGEISIYATMLKVVDPSNPKPNNFGTLEYFIYEGVIQKKAGSLSLLMSGVYSAEISLGNLVAGDYTIYVNGTAFNCEDDQSNIVNLTIIPQSPTELGISIPSTIRILKEFEIRTTLKYMENETTIPSQIVYLNISIGLDSFLVNTITGVEGVSIHDYIISSEYEGQNITIQAAYEGQEKIGRSEISVTQIIYGKIPIILEFIDFPNNTARVGYSATYQVRIDIQDPGEALQNRIILFSSYYDNEISPFTTQQLYTDENGECGYTILELADGKNNITTYFEFLGSTTIAYNFSSRTDNILPKWNSSFNYNIIDEDGDTAYRYGEVIIFNMSFWSPDIGAPSFSGLPVVFTFNYDSISAVETQYVTGNNTVWYLFSIPDSFISTSMNITIEFQGSNKVNNNTISFFIAVEDKITADIEFVISPSTRYILGSHAISVNLSTSDGYPLSNVLLKFQLCDANLNPIGVPVEFTTNDNGIATVTLDFTNQGKNYYVTVDVDDTYGYYEVTTLTSEPIKVTTEFMAFIEDYGIYILIGAIVVVSAYLILTYGYKKPKQRKKRAFLKQMYQKLSDVENIQYCLILTADGGIPIFSKSLAEVPIDETLISGFLSAISSFGAEIGSKIQKSEGGGLEELSYKQFKIIINEGDYVKVALLLLRRPHESLKKKLKSFNYIFEETYKQRLVSFTGEMFDEVQVTKLMEESFETDLLYPHQLIQTRATNYIKESSRKDIPKKIVIIAQGDEFESNFYLREMIDHLKTKGIEEVKSFESLEQLKESKIVFAINPRTSYLIEQFQGYINSMDFDDRNVLFAIFDGNNNLDLISKYLKKRQIQVSKHLHDVIEKLRDLKVIDGFDINDTGTVVATLLKLIPDL